MNRNAIKFGLFLLPVLAVLCLCSDAGWTFERSEFGRLLEMMPPDGPPEHYGNMVLRERSTEKGMAPVIFPHWLHRARYTCQVCHLELDFSMSRGETGISRGGNLAGRHCGACHDGKTAFGVSYGSGKHCNRCHVKDLKDLDAKFKKFAKDMPGSSYGNRIDWNKALSKGSIRPRGSLHGDDISMKLPKALRRPLKLGTATARSAVSFSHEKHLLWVDCSICHPDIFNIKKKGTRSFSMDKNMYGWFCGACHLSVAFPMKDCNRCHPEMKSGVRAKGF